jgi:excisionase family DNA binding protein
MKWLTGFEAAAMLRISRRTLYRWHHEGRLPQWQWTAEQIEARRPELHKRQRGPTRNPDSKRYTIGRHSFDRSNSQCNH